MRIIYSPLFKLVILISIIFILVGFTFTTQAFVPENATLPHVVTTSNSPGEIEVGNTVDITVIVKNFTPNTIFNITIFEEISTETELVSSPMGQYNGSPQSFQGDDLSIFNPAKRINTSISFLNVTSANFTLNVPSLNSGDTLAYTYVLNMTTVGTITLVGNVEIIWYDHYGDPQPLDNAGKFDPLESANDLGFVVLEVEECELCSFFPDTEVDEANSRLLIILGFAVIVIAVLSRGLYGNRPVEL